MHKKIKTTKLGITENSVIFDEIADLIEANDKFSEFYESTFVPNEIQQKVRDIIQYCELPEGETVHILLYGSVGSGKTWAALDVAATIMTQHPGCIGIGVRRTYDEIGDALFNDYKEFLDKFRIPFSSRKKPFNITMHNGSIMRFRSAEKTAGNKTDKADDLGGTRFSFAIIDEADEVPEKYARTLAGRMRS